MTQEAEAMGRERHTSQDGATGQAPEEWFGGLADRYLAEPEVTAGTGFGQTPGLRVGGKIFAMLMGGALVVKLPRERVEALVADGSGTRFQAGAGRVMREWVTVPAGAAPDWEGLAGDALAFVRAGAKRSRAAGA